MTGVDNETLTRRAASWLAARLAGPVEKLRPHLSGGLSLVSARLLPIAVGLVSFPLLTRILGPAHYGQLSLVNSLVGVTSMFAGTWISSALHRYYANDVKKYGQAPIDRWIYLGALPVSLALAFLGLAAIFWVYPVDALLIAGAFVLVAANILYSAAVAAMQALLRFRVTFIMELVKSAAYVGLLLILVLVVGLGIEGAIWAAALAGLTVVLFLLGHREQPVGELLPRDEYWSKFLRYGVPMTASGVGTWVLQLSDRWFLAAFHGDVDVGTYAANYSLIEFIVRYPMQMILLFFSVHLFRIENLAVAMTRFRSLRPYVLALSVAAVILAIAVGGPLVNLLASSAYQQPWALLAILAAAQGIQIVAMYEAIALQLKHRTTIVMTATLAAAGLNLVLNALLVPAHAAVGAALATLASYAVLTAIILASRRYSAAGSIQEADGD